MKTILKTLAIAALGALTSTSVLAAPLSSLAGSYNWKLQGVTSEYSPAAVARGNESTFGIGEITDIRTTSGNIAWQAGNSGEYLYYMIYGIADLGISLPSLYNVGCIGGPCDGKIHIDIYQTSAPIANILLQDPDNRTGFSTFAGVTNFPGASLYLALTLETGKVLFDNPGTTADDTQATLFQTVFAETLPTNGFGAFYADAVGGSAMAKWDTNGFPVAGGLFRDFDGNFTLKPNYQAFGGACPNNAAANDCMLGLINDPIQSNAIPEPGTLALGGLALLAIGAARRRRTA